MGYFSLWDYFTFGVAAGIALKLMMELFFYGLNSLLGFFRNIR